MSQLNVEETGVEAVQTEPPTARWLGHGQRHTSPPLHRAPRRSELGTKSSPVAMNRGQWKPTARFTKLGGKLEIGPAQRLAGDLVWRGILTEVACSCYGFWLKSRHSVVAVVMEFDVTAMVVGQSIRAEEKRGEKGGSVESCSR
jgi:hypothetical protein